MQNLHNIAQKTHASVFLNLCKHTKCYSNCVNIHNYCSFVNNILLISLFLSLLCLCSSQFAANPTNTVQPPLNHHHHNPSQLITTHAIPITKTKESQTQNQTFNGKLDNLEPKIKLSTKIPINPNSKSNPDPNWSHGRHHCHGVLATAMREERNKCFESYGKGKDKKIMKRKDHGRGSKEEMWFCEKKRGSNIMGWG